MFSAQLVSDNDFTFLFFLFVRFSLEKRKTTFFSLNFFIWQQRTEDFQASISIFWKGSVFTQPIHLKLTLQSFWVCPNIFGIDRYLFSCLICKVHSNRNNVIFNDFESVKFIQLKLVIFNDWQQKCDSLNHSKIFVDKSFRMFWKLEIQNICLQKFRKLGKNKCSQYFRV